MKNRMFHAAVSAVFVLAAASQALAARSITSCGSIDNAGAYVLKRNLTATGTCLVVNSDFVTIDLAGYTISGNGTGTGIAEGPGPSSVSNVEVRGGTIVGFQVGINLSSTVGGAIVDRMRLVRNSGTGILCGNSCSITGNTLEQNGAGIVVNEAARVVGNTIAEGTAVVTSLSLGDNSYASGNTLLNNAGGGIDGANNNIVSDNTVSGSGSAPIQLGDGSTVTRNSVQNNVGGFSVGRASSVIGNTLYTNGGGLSIRCPSSVIENTAVNNGVNLALNTEDGACLVSNNLAP